MKKIFFLLLGFVLLCSNVATAQNVLSKTQADLISQNIFKELTSEYIKTIESNWMQETLVSGDYEMPFWYKTTGLKPEGGYAIFISMHGGGGTTKEANDQQWNNQKRLYGDVQGIYWVPRAPTDSWNLWHQDYMEDFLLQVVTYSVNVLGANPNKVYLMGYSAGGDGTFNLAPRLSDRFAAAAMMAGHPGDAVAENLNNLPFAIYMGGKDSAYDRNLHAKEWGEKLDALSEEYEGEFEHRVVIYEDKGHWMDGEDGEAIEWLPMWVREANPSHIIWVQDDVLATRKYNLEVSNPEVGKWVEVKFDKSQNRIDVVRCDSKDLKIWLNDDIMDLDSKVKVYNSKGRLIYNAKPLRSQANIEYSIKGIYDPERIYPAVIEIKF